MHYVWSTSAICVRTSADKLLVFLDIEDHFSISHSDQLDLRVGQDNVDHEMIRSIMSSSRPILISREILRPVDMPGSMRSE